MFKHDRTVYLDLSTDLRDNSDWNAAALRSFEYPLDVTTLAVEPISSLLAIGTATGVIHIFGGVSVETRLSLPTPVKVKFLQFSSSTFQIVCLDEQSQLHIWDLSSFGRPKLVTSARFDQATSLTLSPSHSHAFIALESGEIRTYDLLQSPVETVVHPRDLNLLFTQRNTLRAYEFVLPAGAPGGSGYGHPDILTHRRPAVTAIAVHPAGHFFAAGYSDGSIAFWAIEDEDQPLHVRTLDTTNVNVVDPLELEKHHDAPFEREPIYKLSWSSFSNSSDPRGGQTALTILGGLIMADGEAAGLNVYWLPAFNPPEPPTITQAPLHPFMRSAMQASLIPLSEFFYCTPGVAQDFFLVPRNSPHFSGHHDPTAIVILTESVGNTRAVETYQFPPPVFLASSELVTEKEDEESGSVVDDLASTLKSLTVDDDPHPLRLPVPLYFGATGLLGAQLLTLDRDSYESFVGGKRSDSFALPLRGGAAWADESKAREMRLAKYQLPRVLMTHHRDLAAALQFHDISAQLLTSAEASPIGNHFPNPLPSLTINLKSLLTDAAVVKKTSPTFINHAAVQSAHLARQSLECAVVFASGELIVYRLKSDPAGPLQFKETLDEELVLLEHVLSPDGSRFTPYFLLTTGKPVSACAISDIGFLAAAYTESLIVVDMRSPRVMFRRGRDKKKDTRSILHASEPANSIISLTWSISTLENDSQLRIRLIVAYTSGATEILTIVQDANSSTWKTDPEIKKAEGAANPLPGGTFLLDSKNAALCNATRDRLAQSFKPTASDTHCLFVTAGSKGARCFADITGTRIGKTDWGNKVGTVLNAQVVEKMGSHALVAFTDRHEALVYSLPHLEFLSIMKLPGNDGSSSLTCDETGDWMMSTLHDTSGTIDQASYGTLFDFRRAYTPPDIGFFKPTVPPQPQPVSLGPASLLSSWFRFGQSMTGEQLDTLLGGPDRPIPEKSQSQQDSSSGSQTNASSLAQTAVGVQSSLYARLQSAVGERGQMLGDLEDRFNSLEEGSRSMVAQAKRLAAEQSAKSWFGF
ncbi:lethal giant larvae like, C-terminal-domain-containing protein [Mycena sp. CBHHK59/15]|nr:lethal giant larvae like, C-terminal-domain-containing protein [Mycena sp. CBHHK59/15]